MHQKPTLIMNGRIAGQAWLAETKQKISQLSTPPKLVIIQVGNHPASTVYIQKKMTAAAEVGAIVQHIQLAEAISQVELVNLINQFQTEQTHDGILVQLPLPNHINEEVILKTLKAEFDVDGLSWETTAQTWMAKKFDPLAHVLPCTPKGVIRLLQHYGVSCASKNVVIINRSNIVGKPLAAMLMALDATVTLCHSRTPNISAHTLAADLVISAVGRPNFIQPEQIATAAYVIDVSINFDAENKIVGDVPKKSLLNKCAGYSPVPSGVGPMTVAAIFDNLYLLAKKKEEQKCPK
ncbi:methylenetetrahydrofolate dehydrogenase (NADP+)/methenyltetrahydrofolate cyclohydrolase [Mycoplasmoides fastidiosum]|uniref:Bifunctional protein FolD n=1 Tax=Mycoplasmoides fastidiosum TaxID=92758 RepID=A0ABU0LY58_9BACT|nr:bifunctional 5,10-methylenetetrahydrofolate dehydrogenase/5,10-methenyltetrahydrofolate cyclohydrolase [Mycoplasmoides fastidiosum]MDQ0513651.1 methylenetetrahydrofolate dehydrogenase (NADP+)/methenyltetrahydrofolate cyclohydrolase [Mycoplasmoides fastidiosum]UUD37929.1 bifunctional 5,10-methylenetetrahydrofolate dehydrogenase/5,10-methenyltetrahydrofolate cyclohydrolase [Mycoplasmoides fastidiosum]